MFILLLIILVVIIWTAKPTVLPVAFQINHDFRSYENDFYFVFNMINLIILWAIMTGTETDNFFGEKIIIHSKILMC